MSNSTPTRRSKETGASQPEQAGGSHQELAITCTIELRVGASDDARTRPTATGTIPDAGPKTQTGQGMDRDRTHPAGSPFVFRLSFEISTPSAHQLREETKIE